MAQKIGDQLISNRQYQDLYRQWCEARTPQPFKSWAAHQLSPAGARDRELAAARQQYEDQTKAAAWAEIEAQRQAMDAEVNPRRDPEVAALLELANERDIETGDYSMDALAAQRQLAPSSIRLVTIRPE